MQRDPQRKLKGIVRKERESWECHPLKPVFMLHIGAFVYLRLHAFIEVSTILKATIMIKLFFVVASESYLFNNRTLFQDA